MNSKLIRAAVAGACGKMGKIAVQAIEQAPDLDLVAKIVRGDDFEEALTSSGADVVVDFTTPQFVDRHLRRAVELGIHPVIGTTGLNSDSLAFSKSLAAESSLGGVVAPNFAVGAVLMERLSREVSRHFSAVEIIEAHHPDKKDVPSGTALRTREVICESTRKGTEEISIHSIRLPGYVASQEVIFGGLGERLSIRHDSFDRQCYAPGILIAVRAAPQLDRLVCDLGTLLFSETDRCRTTS